ncbi:MULTISPECIES: DUF7684 family protein [Acinetobacter]|uniref:DUF7684 domain-containing protein n=1 Tax=Acinetobacter genomosp. 33YU TaxID=1675530 RepID=A0A1V2UXU1_9GAMM|nr:MULTISPECIES: hypothetical protein [Acinetobacter]ONN54389.1 hypothetical protein AC058_11550 [Acinetobacter genomosp. 33YU]
MEKDCLDIRSYRIKANEEKHLILPEQLYYIILVVKNGQILPEWRNWICEQIVYSKHCIQAMVTGYECSIWDDVLDETYLVFYNYQPPVDHCFMTTWYEDETLEDITECTKTTMQLEDISNLVIVHIE